MVVLKKINVLSLAKLQAVLMAVFGLIMALLSGIFLTAFGGKLTEYYSGMGMEVPLFGWMQVITTPLIYAIVGFISGAVIALLYNLVAKWIGGIKLELKT